MSFRAMRLCWWQAVGVAIVLPIALSANSSIAQISPDRTLPNNSNVRLEGNTRIISGGTTRGANLFHSFSEFSVPSGSTALFNNALDIQNIISRVTSQSISNIDGLIRANGTANLFLINSNGIVFGRNAQLNIGGSFVATTANAIGFGNLGFFSGSNPEAPSPLLTINPSALLFNQIAAPIQNNSVAPTGSTPAGLDAFGLRVPNGRSLLLVGGNISMDGGKLNAFGGRVELGGLAGTGAVMLNVNDNNLSLSFPVEVARTDVSLTNGAQVDVRANNKGGDINITAGSLSLTSGALLSASSFGLGDAGNITISASNVISLNGAAIFSGIEAPDTVSKGGDINISTGSLSLSNGAQLSASSSGLGNAGNITIFAQKQISLENGGAFFSRVDPQGVGKGGDIRITTGSLSLTSNALLSASSFGRGDAGNITISAPNGISLNGAAIFIGTETPDSVGKGGDINISTGSLSLTNAAQLYASNRGLGNAGNITISAQNEISLENGGSLFSRVESQGVGKGGNINITTGSLSLTSNALLSASSFGRGDAGNITISAPNGISLNGAAIFSGTETPDSVGKGGDINISTGSLSLTNAAQLYASNRGLGNAGNITISAPNGISLDNGGAIFSRVDLQGVGKGGNINITTGSLSLTSGALLSASSFGRGDAGNITISAPNGISLNGAAIFSGTETPDSVGKGGDIKISTGSLSLTNAAQLYASDRGLGNAGNITISAPNGISLDNGGAIFSRVESQGVGKGGDINITTGSLSLSSNALLSASSFGRGDAGNITISAPNGISLNGAAIFIGTETPDSVGKGGDINISTGSLSLTNAAQLYASDRGLGNAGNITISAPNGISLDNGGAIFSKVEPQGVGKGGDINITTGSLSLTNGALLNVSSLGQGIAGNIVVTSGSIRLDNQASIQAETFSVNNGGNINLRLQDLLLLRHKSRISTNAGTAASGGDGGNITINAPNGFIVAVPNENSDITANAFKGRGGNINIRERGIFGIQRREEQTPQSDITASSELGINGTIQIITTDIDLSNGLVELPVNLVDASRQIYNACTPGTRQFQNTFVATGRGGLPMNPTEPLQDSGTISAWVRLKTQSENSEYTTTQPQPTAISNTTKVAVLTTPIVAATGWVIDRNGNVQLVAQVPQVNPEIPWQTPATCPVSQ